MNNDSSSNIINSRIIRDSLLNSVKLGIPASRPIQATRLNKDSVADRRLHRDNLMFIIDSLLDNLFLLNDLDNLIFTDEDGYILFYKENTQNQAMSQIISLGVCMAEPMIGCNAIGLALKHLKTITTHGNEHFLNCLKEFTMVAVPIERNKKRLGCVGFILPASENINIKIDIMENALKNAVYASIKMLEAKNINDDIYLLNHFLNQGDIQNGLLVINKSLNVIEMNRPAELIMQLNKSKVIGHSIEEFTPLGSFKNAFIKSPKNIELIFSNPWGKKYIAAQIAPVISDNKHCAGWILSFSPSNNKLKSTKKFPARFEFNDIIGNNKLFMRSINLAKAITASPSNVLITGESGTGKELFAQSIHYASQFKNGPLVSINCAAIPHELMESELFGYVEGAFTGAQKGGSRGKFLSANNGTIFLDEIGDMPLALQARLLKVLQDRVVIPVGGNKCTPINIRVISATNQNLEDLVEKKQFRLDLFYRLNVINIQIPPLRERQDDVALLARYFLKKHSLILGKDISNIDHEALSCLERYPWPGNVRELENVIEMATNLAQSKEITIAHLPSKIINSQNTAPLAVDEQAILPLDQVLEKVEEQHIAYALQYCSGNISHTASALKITRATLYRKIEKFNFIKYIKH